MKGFILLYLFISVLGKNVFDINKFVNQKHEKRDAKNVVDLSKFIEVIDKRQEMFTQEKFTQETVIQEDQLLTSILPQFSSISIFAGYVRDNKEISRRAETKDESMLIICPTDNAITNKLTQKPWEFPQALGGDNDDEVVESNLNYFISNHIVQKLDNLNINQDGNTINAKLLNGKEITITQDLSGIRLGIDGRSINVEKARQVANGYIFIIDDCLVYN